MLIEGKGEDEEVEDEEKLEEEESLKKNCKVIITKPTKTSTVVFNRKSSRKKTNKEGEIRFKRPPPPSKKEWMN